MNLTREPTAGYTSLSCARPLAACSGRLCGGAAGFASIGCHAQAATPRLQEAWSAVQWHTERSKPIAPAANSSKGQPRNVDLPHSKRRCQVRFSRCDGFAATAARARRSSPRGSAHACHARGAVARPNICGPCGSWTWATSGGSHLEAALWLYASGRSRTCARISASPPTTDAALRSANAVA